MNLTNPIPIFEPECQFNPTRFCSTHTQPESQPEKLIKVLALLGSSHQYLETQLSGAAIFCLYLILLNDKLWFRISM